MNILTYGLNQDHSFRCKPWATAHDSFSKKFIFRLQLFSTHYAVGQPGFACACVCVCVGTLFWNPTSWLGKPSSSLNLAVEWDSINSFISALGSFWRREGTQCKELMWKKGPSPAYVRAVWYYVLDWAANYLEYGWGGWKNLICGQMIWESWNENYISRHERSKRESWGELN